jgi:hypothetical protein
MSATSSIALFPRGGSYAATHIEAHKLQGSEVAFPDSNRTNTDRLNSGAMVHMRLVKNTSGGTLSANQLCKADTSPLVTTDGVAGGSDRAIGAVDCLLGTATVPNEYYYWSAYRGPHPVICSGAGVTTNTVLKTATGGKVVDSAGGATDVGLSLETGAAVDNTVIMAMLDLL